MIRKTLTAAALVAGLTAGAAGPALAEHGHFVIREDRDGQTHCRYIAQGQTAKDPEQGDPGAHKFHHNVHLGAPGSDEHGTDFDKAGHEDDWTDEEGQHDGRCDDTVEQRGSKAANQ